jgi:hypothetical protein
MIQLDKQFVPFLSAQEIARNRKMTAQVEPILKMKYPFL